MAETKLVMRLQCLAYVSTQHTAYQTGTLLGIRGKHTRQSDDLRAVKESATPKFLQSIESFL